MRATGPAVAPEASIQVLPRQHRLGRLDAPRQALSVADGVDNPPMEWNALATTIHRLNKLLCVRR